MVQGDWTTTCLLAGALCICCLCRADPSWNFGSITSKAAALLQVQHQWSSISPADFTSNPPAGSPLTPGEAKLADMYNSYLATFNFTELASSSVSSSYRGSFANFCQNMEAVYTINSDPTLPWFASGNEFSGYSFADFSAMRLMKPGSTVIQGVYNIPGSNILGFRLWSNSAASPRPPHTPPRPPPPRPPSAMSLRLLSSNPPPPSPPPLETGQRRF